MSVSLHDVGRRGAVRLVDRALVIARGLAWTEWLQAMTPALAISWLSLSLYFVERVEGIRSLRLPFAMAFVSAYVARAVVLGRFAGRRVQALLSEHGLTTQHGDVSTLMRTSLWVGTDLWTWLWLLVAAVRVDPWLVPLVLPTLSLRAALAPSWLADADTGGRSSGFRILRKALDGADGHRLAAVGAELLLLLGSIGLAFNLGAVSGALVSAGQEMLGLDLSFVQAFLSPKNHFALLVIACLALSALDPLRAIIAAQIHTETRLTRDGLLIRALVDAATRPTAKLSAWLLLSTLLVSASAHAQRPEPTENEPRQASLAESADALAGECDEACRRARDEDGEVESQVERILADDIFREFPDPRFDDESTGKGALSKLIERIVRYLMGLDEDETNELPKDQGPPLGLPGPAVFAIVAAVIGALAVGWLLNRERAPSHQDKPLQEHVDPFDVPADQHLQEAAQLSERDLSAALRALYLAALVGMAKRGVLVLSHERTNGQYLRALESRDDRLSFAALTRIFERVFYGHQAPSMEDYEASRALALRLLEVEVESS